MSGVFEYACVECGASYKREAVRYLCPSCSKSYVSKEPLRGVLEAVYDYEAAARAGDVWEALMPIGKEHFPPLPVGNTPLMRAARLGEALGYGNLFVKNDGQNPTGSLKDRASAMIVAEANRLGEKTIVTASTGNAASALAAMCASVGKQAIIYVPARVPRAKLAQMLIYGADVRLVDGDYDDAFALSLEHTQRHGGLNRNTAYHPLTIEGKKTVSFEIFRDLLRAPDYVVVPVGDGVIISAVFKGFYDLARAGLLKDIPKLVCVQAESSDAITRYVSTGTYQSAAAPSTIADSISVKAPSNALMASRAIKKSQGLAVTVSDAEILGAQRLLARTTGVFAEPSAAAGVAGLEKCREHIHEDAWIVTLVTGHGLKDVDAAMTCAKVPPKMVSPIDRRDR